MASVRLKKNFIAAGVFYRAGSVVDLELIPPHLRDSLHIDRDLENREGRVLLLRDLSFQSLPRSSASGIPSSFPTHVAAGELIDLAQVPESTRKALQEGLDFKTAWTHQELEEARRTQEDLYASSDTLKAEPRIENR